MIVQNIIEFFKKLFPGINPKTTNEEQERNANNAVKYVDISGTNITAIAAGKLANLVAGGSKIRVSGINPRARFLDETLKTCSIQLRNITCRSLGTGGVILKPTVHNGKIHTDIIGQELLVEVEQVGNEITKAGFIAETFKEKDKVYRRIEYHALENNGLYTIEQKASVDGEEIPLTDVPKWSKLPPIQQITGVTQMLFSLVKCPADNRKSFSNVYGVPITYGQDKLMAEICELLNEMQKEFINKRAFVGIDSLLFSGDNKLPVDGVYKKFQTDTEDFWEVYSPEIRYLAYICGLDYKMAFLENAIGVSKGILTNLDTRNATATEVRRSTLDTAVVVESVRAVLESEIKQLVYAYDVIANVNNLVPKGDYEVVFDWSQSLWEDSIETFEQHLKALSAGWTRPEEGRSYFMEEDIETAKKNLPEMEQLLRAE